jgi:tRNA A37 N6-isopentenylltransferase MiaA
MAADGGGAQKETRRMKARIQIIPGGTNLYFETMIYFTSL